MNGLQACGQVVVLQAGTHDQQGTLPGAGAQQGPVRQPGRLSSGEDTLRPGMLCRVTEQEQRVADQEWVTANLVCSRGDLVRSTADLAPMSDDWL